MERPLTELAGGQIIICGVASLDNWLYVLRGKPAEQVEVYDTNTSNLRDRLIVPGLGDRGDIVACPRNRCAYISDYSNDSIHRVCVSFAAPSVTNWPVNDKPACLSVTDKHNVLATCCKGRKIKEFSTDGKLLRQFKLPADTLAPWHTILLSSGQYIVSHCFANPSGNSSHRVCLLDSDRHVVQSFGGPQGSGSQQLNMPRHVAVGRKGYVFVADQNNCRVVLLSPSLHFVREVVSGDQLEGRAERLCLDKSKRVLYVAVNKKQRGRVVVVRV